MLNLKSVPGAPSGRSSFRAEWVDVSDTRPTLTHLGRKLASLYEVPAPTSDARLKTSLEALLRALEPAERTGSSGEGGGD